MKTTARKNHRSSRARTSCLLGAAAAAALLASTGCGPSDDDGSATAEPKDTPSATSPASSTSAPSPTATATGSTGGDDGSGSGVAACTAGSVSLSATSADGKGKNARHILLTVANTGGKKCTVYHYPYLRFPDAREPVAVIKDSADDPVTLAPGEQAYAALLANGGGMDTYDTKTVPLSLQGPTPGSRATDPVEVALPGTVSFDDGAQVTYWTTASGLVLRFIMSH
ncbi:DUF4232 domain-containing protein [Streptomyces cocklensis]|uniref:DUF4232 domain-containing protein n=1 Tax=Actinacidiphila cocklensis TaxID=887465 RepID=A0A9W4E0S9_9ACTN|nr:DUF4232 domain-containing protein [Actinacidiphila cocklensis]MDD1058751.1 DUF4232 domain-containing protein [Actinacidiphila cocklensis]CAG6398867.1 conserved exported hypothetical protein [Actinacidiphila cocklensis]